MTTAPPLTLLDLAFDILTVAKRPLSAEDIAETAEQAGYLARPDEIQAELDNHILDYGPYSPFVPVGETGYDLIAPAPARSAASYVVWATLGLSVVILLLISVVWRSFPARPVDKPAVTAAVPLPAQPALPTTWIDPSWWDANAANQLNAETQRVARKFLSNRYNTCGPAVLAVMANYWRDRLGANPERVTAGEVIKSARTELGYFNPPYNSGLLDFKGLRAIGGLFELDQAYPVDSRPLMTLDDLLMRLKAGEPAIAGMRYAYQGPDDQYLPSGGSGIYNHFVIVIEALQESGEITLRVFNPHPGLNLVEDIQAIPTLMSLDEFQRSWAINDGSEITDYGYAAFFQISR